MKRFVQNAVYSVSFIGFKTHHTVDYLVEKRPVFIETLKYLKNDVLLSFKQKNVQQKY